MKKNILYCLWLVCLIGCTQISEQQPEMTIIPRPLNITPSKGEVILDASWNITSDNPSLANISDYLSIQMNAIVGFELPIQDEKSESENSIFLTIDTSIDHQEGYSLEIMNDQIIIRASTSQGVFYGVQSLLQLIQKRDEKFVVPNISIEDQPRFAWRGMHLDVSRHFFDVDKIKKYIDYLAMYKLNTFHWHLTDDQGWRIEIKKYPLLTEVGAWRSKVGFPSNQANGLDEDNGKPYGGFYTQDEIREVVAYAKERFIDVVPEIEMPGHTSEVLQAYPELQCTQAGNSDARLSAGVSNKIFCAGNEKTFEFLENVLVEVMDLFPSSYIHIGGDEVPKVQWQGCSLCQTRIKEENLSDEDELQSYFIERMEKFINKNDRKIIGWDEILEGGLAPNATVMSWRGIEGGIDAAQQGHDVIMTPGFPLYFNHRTIDVENSPGHKSSNNTLKTVYEFEPVPEVLSAEESKFVIGVQANLWTEYIPKWEHVESLLFPRMLSLSEVAWTHPDQKNYQSFRSRLPHHLSMLDRMGVNYGKDLYHVFISMEKEDQKLMVSLKSAFPGLQIRYTIDGSMPSSSSAIYSDPFACREPMTIKAAAFIGDKVCSEISEVEYLHHKALVKEVKYKNKYNSRYQGEGAFGLVDGQFGMAESVSKGWQGFDKDNFEVLIDLGEIMLVNYISTGFLTDQNQWIFHPEQVIYQVSEDGATFNTVFEKEFADARNKRAGSKVDRWESDFTAEARYIKIVATNDIMIPEWHAGADTRPWLFIDEIVVK